MSNQVVEIIFYTTLPFYININLIYETCTQNLPLYEINV